MNATDDRSEAPRDIRVAADVMNRSPRTCSKFSHVIEAVMIYKDEDCGIVPVVDAGKPIGVVTDRDVTLALAEKPDLVDHPIEEIMTTDLVTVTPDTPIEEVVKTFGDGSVRRLLVVDSEGLLAGVISWKDVSPALPERELGQIVTEVVESPASS